LVLMLRRAQTQPDSSHGYQLLSQYLTLQQSQEQQQQKQESRRAERTTSLWLPLPLVGEYQQQQPYRQQQQQAEGDLPHSSSQVQRQAPAALVLSHTPSLAQDETAAAAGSHSLPAHLSQALLPLLLLLLAAQAGTAEPSVLAQRRQGWSAARMQTHC
jgi:hypothetical protein